MKMLAAIRKIVSRRDPKVALVVRAPGNPPRASAPRHRMHCHWIRDAASGRLTALWHDHDSEAGQSPACALAA